MLHDERRRPQIVGRDRGSLRSELAKQPPVLMRRLFVGIEHLDSRRTQKTRRVAFVPLRPRPTEKPARSSASTTRGTSTRRARRMHSTASPSPRAKSTSDWCRWPSSSPHRLVDPMLVGDGAIELGILVPRTGERIQVVVQGWRRHVRAGLFRQRVAQQLARPPPQCAIDVRRDAPDRVLHGCAPRRRWPGGGSTLRLLLQACTVGVACPPHKIVTRGTGRTPGCASRPPTGSRGWRGSAGTAPSRRVEPACRPARGRSRRRGCGSGTG